MTNERELGSRDDLEATGADAPVIVIGAATGGVCALRALVAGLPADLPAAVVVLVTSRDRRSGLSELLERAGRLPVVEAQEGTACLPGRIHVVPAGAHLALEDGRFVPGRGRRPRRPISELMRSAATSCGRRAIGVILSGPRDDGATGLQAIARRGGRVVAQDPRDADVPAMPCAALRTTDVDWVVPAAAAGSLLARLVCEPALRLA